MKKPKLKPKRQRLNPARELEAFFESGEIDSAIGGLAIVAATMDCTPEEKILLAEFMPYFIRAVRAMLDSANAATSEPLTTLKKSAEDKRKETIQ